MSLPSPSTGRGGFATFDPKQQEAMDAPLIALTQACGGDLRRLLFAFFSFLNRRTDFYVVANEEDVKAGVPLKMGFREGDAEKLLLASFRQFPLRRAPRQGGKAAVVASSARGGPSSSGTDPSPSPSKREEKSMRGETKPRLAAESSKKDPARLSPDADDHSVRFTEEGKQVPVGNGGSTERYQWTQTLDETSVIMSVPPGTRGKDLAVSLKISSVSVRMKKPLEGEDSPRCLLEGNLVDQIDLEESTWTLEGGALLLQLGKKKKTWWETVMVGDAEIDTSLVDSTRKINTYDESTQAAIRRILFDQRQERLGLPKSDEISGSKPKIPPLPPGVEYIDKLTLDENKGKT